MRRIVLTVALCAWFVAPAVADMSVSFHPIDTTNPYANRVADQLTVAVSSTGKTGTAGANQVLFYFTNTGSIASNVTEIYFDDGTLLGITALQQDPAGTSFYEWTDLPTTTPKPGDLPGGDSLDPKFDVTTYFAVDSACGNGYGINPGEHLGIIFDLKGGGTLQTVLNELASGELRIGMHVRSVNNGGSVSFVNDPLVVPVPGAALLGTLGLGAAGLRLRRRA